LSEILVVADTVMDLTFPFY